MVRVKDLEMGQSNAVTNVCITEGQEGQVKDDLMTKAELRKRKSDKDSVLALTVEYGAKKYRGASKSPKDSS